jgi:hypothetical protein
MELLEVPKQMNQNFVKPWDKDSRRPTGGKPRLWGNSEPGVRPFKPQCWIEGRGVVPKTMLCTYRSITKILRDLTSADDTSQCSLLNWMMFVRLHQGFSLHWNENPSTNRCNASRPSGRPTNFTTSDPYPQVSAPDDPIIRNLSPLRQR